MKTDDDFLLRLDTFAGVGTVKIFEKLATGLKLKYFFYRYPYRVSGFSLIKLHQIQKTKIDLIKNVQGTLN